MRAKVTYNFRLNLFVSEASIVCSGILTCCTIHVCFIVEEEAYAKA